MSDCTNECMLPMEHTDNSLLACGRDQAAKANQLRDHALHAEATSKKEMVMCSAC